jgi:ribonuclease BN (tRNA processing enzyme)
MRSRLCDYPACRLYGPPGLAQHIAGFIRGVLWDRVQDTGPKFEVREFHDDRLQCFQLQAGFKDTIKLDDVALQDTVLLKERGYRVRGELLDHRGIPVMAYAFEPDKQINVRKDRLKSMGLEPGPWLNELKQHILNGNDNARIVMPDGEVSTAGELARQLVLITPGKKIVYATDFADTADNRQRIISLAQHAHTLFCEAAFCEADVDHAVRNGHLTTRACGEIATAAGVSRLIPFHFSRRYTENPQQLYDEIKVYCTRVVTPQTMDLFEAPAE